MRGWRFGLAALCACNQVFGIEQGVPNPEADAMLADEDGDGVSDVTDNCPKVSNDQADEDEDRVGDACDNCPLLQNSEQADFEIDGIGDICDPDPRAATECLILFESFANVTPFENRWRVLKSMTSGAAYLANAGSVALQPKSSDYFSIIALDDAGQPLTGTFDVTIVGRTTGNEGSVMAASRLENRFDGYWGGLERRTTSRDGIRVETPIAIVSTSLSAARFGERFVVRIITEDPTQLQPNMIVRVDFGIAVGTVEHRSGADVPLLGNTGVVITDQDADIDGFTAYRRQPPPCPPPLLR